MSQILLDTENIFRGFRPTGQTQQSATIQDALFPSDAPDADRGVGRKMEFTLSAILGWSGKNAGNPVGALISYGKNYDPGVRVMIDTLNHVARRTGARSWKWDGVDIRHVAVGHETHAAERRLVDEMRASFTKPSARTPIVMGSADIEAIVPTDHLSQRGFVEPWIILSASCATMVANFGPYGRFSHIDIDHVRTLPQVLDEIRGAETGPSEQDRKFFLRRKHKKVVKTRSGLIAKLDHNDANNLVQFVARLGNIDVPRLRNAPYNSGEWKAALGEARIAKSAKGHLPDLVSVAEFELLRAGNAHPERVATLVRESVIRSIVSNHPTLEYEDFRAALEAAGVLHVAGAELKMAFLSNR